MRPFGDWPRSAARSPASHSHQLRQRFKFQSAQIKTHRSPDESGTAKDTGPSVRWGFEKVCYRKLDAGSSPAWQQGGGIIVTGWKLKTLRCLLCLHDSTMRMKDDEQVYSCRCNMSIWKSSLSNHPFASVRVHSNQRLESEVYGTLKKFAIKSSLLFLQTLTSLQKSSFYI